MWEPPGRRPTRWTFADLLCDAQRVAWRPASKLPPGAVVAVRAEAAGLTHLTRPSDPDAARRETVGRPLEAVQARIVSPDDGTELPPGSVGEVQVRVRTPMSGCLDDPQATAAAFADGDWLRTGDLGSIDDRDFLTITGRHDECIIRAGSTIMPLAVEAAVREHPLVGDAVAVGLPHPRDGECVGVQIVARSGRAPTEDELREHCARLLPAAAVPDRIDVVPALPLSGSGKIRRAAVRQRMLQMPRARP